MNNTSQEFGLFIDNIRSSRNMSREDFVDGIMSTRQFQRYLKGESSISIEKIIMLIDRLELEFFTLYNQFLKSTNEEYNIIYKIYNQIILFQYKDAYDTIENHKNYVFSSPYYGKLFKLYQIITNHKLLRISNEMAITKMEKHINYSEIITINQLNFIELTALIYLSQILDNVSKRKIIMVKLYNVIRDNKISDMNENDNRMITIYASFSKLLGIQHEFEKVVFIAKKGIELCEKYKTTISLADLYYYCALGYLEQGQKEKALSYAKKTFFTLEIENADLRYKAFKDSFEKHFNIKFDDFKTW